jgi:hypothetical protein
LTQSTAIVKTEHASRYLQQLCKHWSHKMVTEFDAKKGRIDFASGAQVFMNAAPEELTVRIETPDDEGLPRLETVVEDHIKRFAFREELEFAWNRQA